MSALERDGMVACMCAVRTQERFKQHLFRKERKISVFRNHSRITFHGTIIVRIHVTVTLGVARAIPRTVRVSVYK